jgi:prepilin-type processing-associated H-X9-DG protein
MNHNYWVRRQRQFAGFGPVLPDPQYNVANTDPAIYGWPIKTIDRGSAHVPFISDACFSGYSTAASKNVTDINTSFANNAPLPPAQKYSGHCIGTTLKSVNVTYVDGHVESHNSAQIQCVYLDNQPAGWFY